MQRYFVQADKWTEYEVSLNGDDFHHVVNVMRMVVGDIILCSHPDGMTAKCKIQHIGTETVNAKIIEWIADSAELPIKVSIAQGLPKGDKWEYILQKATELGASELIAFQGDRSVVKWDEKKVIKKRPRWEKIVKEASEQAHRNKIPTVSGVWTFDSLLERSVHYDCKFFAYEEEVRDRQSKKLHDYFSNINQGASVLICIGPEGGFSEQEATLLKKSSFQPVRFGPRILRTETAPLYALSSLSYYFEEMR
ncbi:16S rRNA (uracil(1498)-N(3))-methyltransferase [Gracilibacillus dipsosauri]|uniref:16S rRNA (uracil(1498)-N(3))-methyltransferase n=1 Tax=Gracilibacillus dipsosauri TaxID=178340 RepID=UPI00240A9506